MIERACDIAKIAISEFDNNGNLVFANSIAYSLFELEPGIKITRDLLLKIVLPEDKQNVKNQLKKISPGRVCYSKFQISRAQIKACKGNIRNWRA